MGEIFRQQKYLRCKLVWINAFKAIWFTKWYKIFNPASIFINHAVRLPASEVNCEAGEFA
ncbi:MAG: hypothetical protein B7Y56_04075 [Gallionellales bacterium 35-53-114]|nr:MAG: hypothetical protein B7Y56_04075 [Gallionellales bacterium 35-53-114]OYZ65275.1 MAG: hypothetical protein B7Y04_01235 [Gallionellales bacterium 24-53-125]OZB08181.1 MAG: hypothetical protein B7X61_11685 [Gallionellales bacterium 39-52-133]